jgi:hypothetical protein
MQVHSLTTLYVIISFLVNRIDSILPSSKSLKLLAYDILVSNQEINKTFVQKLSSLPKISHNC